MVLAFSLRFHWSYDLRNAVWIISIESIASKCLHKFPNCHCSEKMFHFVGRKKKTKQKEWEIYGKKPIQFETYSYRKDTSLIFTVFQLLYFHNFKRNLYLLHINLPVCLCKQISNRSFELLQIPDRTGSICFSMVTITFLPVSVEINNTETKPKKRREKTRRGWV